MYASVIGQSMIIDELFNKIKEKVVNEVRLHQQLEGIVGIMDSLFATASLV